jgi:hypothetical protein
MGERSTVRVVEVAEDAQWGIGESKDEVHGTRGKDELATCGGTRSTGAIGSPEDLHEGAQRRSWIARDQHA